MHPEDSLNRRVFKTVGPHFVSLSCVQHFVSAAGQEKEKILVFSGFVVEINHDWFYVTAGHVLKTIQAALDAGTTFDTWRFDDQTAGNDFKGVAIPYDFNLDEWLVLENEESGLDYATVKLDYLTCKSMLAGKVVPVDKNAWGDYVAEHDYWVLMGIPSESISYDEGNFIDGRVFLIPLKSVEPPPAAGSKSENQFFGRLDDEALNGLRDIDGMSGGPIFSLKKVDTQWKYTVIGIQSAWYRSDKTIAACPFSSFAKALEELITINS
jgi:hypothetical protein